MKNDWIEWKGEPGCVCPLPPAKKVEVRFRDGDISAERRAEEWNWRHIGYDGDIVAYRVIEQDGYPGHVPPRPIPEPATAIKLSNPKDAIGDTKVPLALLSPIASAHWALGQFAGMSKYGAWNWRIAGVRASVYISAMKRHIDAYNSGEEFDPVDGTHHLGNIMACAAILLDAQAAGKLTDDRPPSVDVRQTYNFVQKQMAVLKEKYKDMNPRHYTIADSKEGGVK